ncbi:MAG: hypothetical protein KF693_00920 [Nitrospira sp.]|nr:hypothetical protein [Nitrospira sp.]
MIGIVAEREYLEVVAEFFELFKTPWEAAVPDRRYRVVLATNGDVGWVNADVLLIFDLKENDFDRAAGMKGTWLQGPVAIEGRRTAYPVYRGALVFESGTQDGVATLQGRPVEYWVQGEERVVRRIGYHLFEEVRYLLKEGQPATYALTPTLDIHIDFLRQLLMESKVPFIEIPAVPPGYDHVCCLTHDVDFFGIRRHLFDRTMAGFLYRASLGTVIDLVRGHRSFKEACRNWVSILSLPLVFLRVLPDFWRPFEDYAKVEDRKSSTFFLVPFKGKAGVAPDGSLNNWRATPYGIQDVREDLKAAAAGDSELAIHGIDAWRDTELGREELHQLVSLVGQQNIGVRMHWLYFDHDSPQKLEKAGFDYDSTYGYNEAVGYRAGTSQPFRPVGCSALIELPMTIMDSALFSSGRLSLTSMQAMSLCRCIIEHARRAGGVVVINWHDRSLAPERLLGRFYAELLNEVREGGRVWFAKVKEAVEWFRWRRSIQFSRVRSSGNDIQIKIAVPPSVGGGALVYVYRAGPSGIETDEMPLDGGGLFSIEV